MRTPLVLACFFLSGAAGLVHEICWVRAASLLLGSTAYAVGAVLAVFFLGLAAGSWAMGEATLRMQHPLRAYARLEWAVAAWAAASLPLLHALTPLYGAAYRAAGGDALASMAARVAVLVLVVLPPAALMGGTLPVLCRQFVGNGQHGGQDAAEDKAQRRGRRGGVRAGRRVGALYALNTLGAAVGCALGGLVLIPRLGMQATVWAAAAVNLACGVGAAVAAAERRRPGPAAGSAASSDREPPDAPDAAESVSRRALITVGVLFFAVGLVALGQEVLWTRLLALLIRSSITTATLALTTVLLGIVLGSALAAALADRLQSRARALGALMALHGLAALSLTLLPPAAWRALAGQQLRVLFALLLPTAALSGACFPLAVRMVVDTPQLAAARTGRLAAWNTLGGICGSVLFAFVLLPRAGLQASAQVASGVSVAAAATAWLLLDVDARRWLRVALPALAVAAWALLPHVLSTRVPADHLAPRTALVDMREGREANLAVVRRDDALVLEIDRWWQGQDQPTHQIMAAHLPMLLHPNARDVLVVGVGAGQTPQRFTYHAGLRRLDAVDIEPAVFGLIRRHFAADWTRDPRVRLLPEDGRSYLQHATASYDIVSLELGQLSRPGVASFYTRELYRAARARLAPGGIVSQFVPLAFLTPAALRAVVATFVETFPEATLWYNTGELLLVGAADRAPRLDLQGLAAALQAPRVAEDLRYAHWGGAAEQLRRPAALLGCFLCGSAELDALAAGAAVLRDDRPVLEQQVRGADEQQAREIALVPLLRQHLGALDQGLDGKAPPDTLAEAAALRAGNLGDLIASALLRRVESLKAAGDLTGLHALLGQALASNPRSVLALRLLGDVLLLQGDAGPARPYFERALALRPDDRLSIRGLAMALQRSGDPAAAAAQYRRALALRETDAEAHNNLGVALAQAGDLQGARDHFARAVSLQPDYQEARRNLERARAALQARPAAAAPASR